MRTYAHYVALSAFLKHGVVDGTGLVNIVIFAAANGREISGDSYIPNLAKDLANYKAEFEKRYPDLENWAR